jgi:hypothetical protein
MTDRTMKSREGFTAATSALIRRIRDAAFVVSVHHMGEYVELHAVHLSGGGAPHVARCDGGAQTYQAAKALAEMVGVTGTDDVVTQ